MPRRNWWIALVLALAVPVAGMAAEPDDQAPPLPALKLVPRDAVGFFRIPSVQTLERNLKRFADETGFKVAQGESPVMRTLEARTNISEGLDPARPVVVAWLNPKVYRNRYTLYILPVADWDRLLAATLAEDIGDGLYALTGPEMMGQRTVLRRGDYAVVTSSIRTMKAVTLGQGDLAATLSPRTRRRLAEGLPTLHLDIASLKKVYADEIATWFRSATGQVYETAEATAYGDMFTAYLLGVSNVIDQMEMLEVGLKFGPGGLAADVQARFKGQKSIGEFLSAQTPTQAASPPLGDIPVASAVTMTLDPEARNNAVKKTVEFFLDNAPRPDPLSDPMKKQVLEAVDMLASSLGPRIVQLSAPAEQGEGLASQVSVYQVPDADQFREGIQKVAAAWEKLADDLDFFLKVETQPNERLVAGQPVTLYRPRMRFGVGFRDRQFRRRLKALYGPDGLVYRVALLKGHAVVATGSDLTLMADVIDRLKAGRPLESKNEAGKRLLDHLQAKQNVTVMTSLPVYLKQALVRGGMNPEAIGTVDPGSELAGFSVRFGEPAVTVTSYWPHEQLRLARELLARVAPGLTEVPESLFEPPEEGPPEGAEGEEGVMEGEAEEDGGGEAGEEGGEEPPGAVENGEAPE